MTPKTSIVEASSEPRPYLYAVAGTLFVLSPYLVFGAGALAGDLHLVEQATDEKGLLQVLGALGFFVGGIAFLLGAVQLYRARRFYSSPFWKITLIGLNFLGLAFLFAAGEEVSWGQWIFGFRPPKEIRTINRQGELNLHNMPLPGGGTPSQLMLQFFNLLWLSLTVLIPGVALIKPMRTFLERFMPVLPLVLGAPFLVDYALMRGLIRFTGGALQPYHFRLGEVHESNAAVLMAGIALYTAFVVLPRRREDS